LHRLVVVGQQISPDPAGNTQGNGPVAGNNVTPNKLPGNGPTLLGRLWRTNTGKIMLIIALIGSFGLILFLMNRGVSRWLTA
jgi:hypothetical protein